MHAREKFTIKLKLVERLKFSEKLQCNAWVGGEITYYSEMLKFYSHTRKLRCVKGI